MKYSLPPGYDFLTSIGHARKLLRNPLSTMEESMALHNGTYSLSLGTRKIVVTQDPEFMDHVLRGNHKRYNKSPMLTEQLGKFLGKGLLTSNGEYWRKQRRLIQPGFHTDRIRSLHSMINNTVQLFLLKFPTGESVDVYPLMNRLVFEIVVNTLFNVELSEANRDLLRSHINKIQTFYMKDVRQPFLSWWFKLTGEVRKNLNYAKSARVIIADIIKNSKLNPNNADDLLRMLLDARYEDTGEPMSEEQVIDEVLIMIIAGHESTSSVLSWVLFLLAMHPKEFGKLRQETININFTESVGHDRMLAVIKEAMRLYPPAWVSDRISLQDDAYKQYSYPKGTIVMMFYYGLHRDPQYWDHPESFIPDRFSKENVGKDARKAYLPFAAGPRSCIGDNFAMVEMAIVLHAIIHSFDIEPTDIIPSMKPQVTLRPDQVILKVRKSKR